MSQRAGSDEIKVVLAGRDEVVILREHQSWKIKSLRGCSEFEELIQDISERHPDKGVEQWELPRGDSHSHMLLRELILKAQGRWNLPYPHEEICHCRMVSTKAVDEAIVCGAHSTEVVSRLTTASTSCGTCRPDVLHLIEFRRRSDF